MEGVSAAPFPVNGVPWDLAVGMLTEAMRAAGGFGSQLEAWLRPVPGCVPPSSLCAWGQVWLAQRPLYLEAAAKGYTLEGAEIVAMVADLAREAGAHPVVTVGRVRGSHWEDQPPHAQVGVRIEVPGFEALCYERAPRPGLGRPVPDAWREVRPGLMALEPPRDAADAALLAMWVPGSQDTGQVLPPRDPELRKLEERLAEAPAVPVEAPKCVSTHREPEAPPEAPQEAPPQPRAEVSCGQCRANVLLGVDGVAEEVRLGCKTCGADVGALAVTTLEDGKRTPARAWVQAADDPDPSPALERDVCPDPLEPHEPAPRVEAQKKKRSSRKKKAEA